MSNNAVPETYFTPKVYEYGLSRTVSYLSERAIIRGFRIACGYAVYLFAQPILDEARALLGKRFADLSPMELGEGLVTAAVGIGIAFLALYVAFGPGRGLEKAKREWRYAKELEEYCQMMLERIRQNWSPPPNAQIPPRIVLVAQLEGNGEVFNIKPHLLNDDIELKESLDAAIKESLPVPRAPYRWRLKGNIEMSFYPTVAEGQSAGERTW